MIDIERGRQLATRLRALANLVGERAVLAKEEGNVGDQIYFRRIEVMLGKSAMDLVSGKYAPVVVSKFSQLIEQTGCETALVAETA